MFTTSFPGEEKIKKKAQIYIYFSFKAFVLCPRLNFTLCQHRPLVSSSLLTVLCEISAYPTLNNSAFDTNPPQYDANEEELYSKPNNQNEPVVGWTIPSSSVFPVKELPRPYITVCYSFLVTLTL
jgi:hypothetical protein